MSPVYFRSGGNYVYCNAIPSLTFLSPRKCNLCSWYSWYPPVPKQLGAANSAGPGLEANRPAEDGIRCSRGSGRRPFSPEASTKGKNQKPTKANLRGGLVRGRRGWGPGHQHGVLQPRGVLGVQLTALVLRRKLDPNQAPPPV